MTSFFICQAKKEFSNVTKEFQKKHKLSFCYIFGTDNCLLDKRYFLGNETKFFSSRQKLRNAQYMNPYTIHSNNLLLRKYNDKYWDTIHPIAMN